MGRLALSAVFDSNNKLASGVLGLMQAVMRHA
jgi:hypothetical protein